MAQVMQPYDYDPENEGSAHYARNGYEHEAGTLMLAKSCLICGRPLRDPASIERGVGPYCAEKHKMFAETARPDRAAYEVAIETAPPPMRESIEATGGMMDPRAAVSAAIHAAGSAWERQQSDASHYIGSAMEIATALGYAGTAHALQRVFIEGWKYDEEGNAIEHGKPKGIVVREGEPSRTGQAAWEVMLPFIQGDTWRQTKNAMKAAGVRTYKDDRGKWHDVFPATERQWLLVLNSLVDTLAGTLGVMPSGETFMVPHTALPVPAPEGQAAGAPTTVDEPAPEAAIQVKEGDRIELRDGRRMVVARTGTNAKGQWIGLMTLQDAELSMERFGYLFFKKYNAGFCGLKEVKLKLPTEAEKEAIEEATGERVAPAAAKRDIPEGLQPWQREGVLWLNDKGSGVLAMEQGTGKTPTALAAMDAPVLVVVPASLRENWRREAMKWRPDLVVAKIEKAAELTDEALKASCVIIGYEAASDAEVLDKLKRRRFATLIVDEAQAVKELRVYENEKGGHYPGKDPKRAAALYRLSQIIPRRFFLTGTPMINGRPYELFPLLNMVAPKDWANQEEYWWRYCDPQEVHIPGGKTMLNVHGHANLGELRERTSGHYLFRRTKEVLNLPEKVREYRSIGLSEEAAAEYRQAAAEFLAWVRRRGGPAAAMRAARAEVIARLTALRRIAGIGKVDTVLAESAAFLRDTGRPLIIMGHHDEALSAIEAGLEHLGFRVGMITGKVTGRAREKAIDEFQSGLPLNRPPEKRKYLDALVCSITAAGVGLTLTRAQDMFIFERVWRPFDLVQAEDRIHRYGQKNQCVITYYDGANTIDDKLAALLAEKTATAAEVIDGTDLDEDEAQDVVVRDMFAQLTESMQANPEAELDPALFDWATPDVG